jgi:pimeloyl-[acyl-carrier protein] synthase
VTRLPNLRLAPGALTWRENLGLRGLTALPVEFGQARISIDAEREQ